MQNTKYKHKHKYKYNYKYKSRLNRDIHYPRLAASETYFDTCGIQNTNTNTNANTNTIMNTNLGLIGTFTIHAWQPARHILIQARLQYAKYKYKHKHKYKYNYEYKSRLFRDIRYPRLAASETYFDKASAAEYKMKVKTWKTLYLSFIFNRFSPVLTVSSILSFILTFEKPSRWPMQGCHKKFHIATGLKKSKKL